MSLKIVKNYTQLKKIGTHSAFVLIPKMIQQLMQIKPGDELTMIYNLQLNRIVITTTTPLIHDDKDKDTR